MMYMCRLSNAPWPGCSHTCSLTSVAFHLHFTLFTTYFLIVSLVENESCAFSSPHFPLIHLLITHRLPCCPLQANKWILSCSVPHVATQITPQLHFGRLPNGQYFCKSSTVSVKHPTSTTLLFQKPLTLAIWMSEHPKIALKSAVLSS